MAYNWSSPSFGRQVPMPPPENQQAIMRDVQRQQTNMPQLQYPQAQTAMLPAQVNMRHGQRQQTNMPQLQYPQAQTGTPPAQLNMQTQSNPFAKVVLQQQQHNLQLQQMMVRIERLETAQQNAQMCMPQHQFPMMQDLLGAADQQFTHLQQPIDTTAQAFSTTNSNIIAPQSLSTATAAQFGSQYSLGQHVPAVSSTCANNAGPETQSFVPPTTSATQQPTIVPFVPADNQGSSEQPILVQDSSVDANETNGEAASRRRNGRATMCGFPDSFEAPPRPPHNQSEFILQTTLGSKRKEWMTASDTRHDWRPAKKRNTGDMLPPKPAPKPAPKPVQKHAKEPAKKPVQKAAPKPAPVTKPATPKKTSGSKKVANDDAPTSHCFNGLWLPGAGPTPTLPHQPNAVAPASTLPENQASLEPEEAPAPTPPTSSAADNDAQVAEEVDDEYDFGSLFGENHSMHDGEAGNDDGEKGQSSTIDTNGGMKGADDNNVFPFLGRELITPEQENLHWEMLHAQEARAAEQDATFESLITGY